MTKRIILSGLIGIIVIAAVFFLRTTSNSAAADKTKAPDSYVTLNVSLDQLKADFNAEKGKVRLVFVVGPSCGPCLRGLDDMNRSVGDMTRDNPDLKAFVLYAPTLGAVEQHAARAVKLMRGADIRHYWDPHGRSGVELQEAIGINAYAWDVWLIYGSDAIWSERGPPPPAYWEHQLGGLPHGRRLDPKRFASKVFAILNGDDSDG